MRIYMDLKNMNNNLNTKKDDKKNILSDDKTQGKLSKCDIDKELRAMVKDGLDKIEENKKELEENANKKTRKKVMKGKIVEVDEKGKIIKVIKFLPKGAEKAAIAQFFMEMAIAGEMSFESMTSSEAVDFSESDVTQEDIWMMIMDSMNENDKKKFNRFDQKY